MMRHDCSTDKDCEDSRESKNLRDKVAEECNTDEDDKIECRRNMCMFCDVDDEC